MDPGRVQDRRPARGLSGKKLTGAVVRLPLSQPAQFSLLAVYVCSSEAQVDGFWRFDFVGMEGPNGEQLVAADARPAAAEPDPALVAQQTQNPVTTSTTGPLA